MRENKYFAPTFAEFCSELAKRMMLRKFLE